MNRIITAASAHIYNAWWDAAMRDPTVWPYLGFYRYVAPAKIEGNDWDGVIVMDDGGHGVLSWTLDRADAMRVATVGMWVLDTPDRTFVAANLFSEIPALIKRYGVEMVSASCHASNPHSAPLMRRHFGEPWGIKPKGAWNGLLGIQEDSLHFQIEAATLLAALGARQ